MSFDTLSFAKRLIAAGEKPEVAEAHALALKELVVAAAVASKADIRALCEEIEDLRDDIGEVRNELRGWRKELGEDCKGLSGRCAGKDAAGGERGQRAQGDRRHGP